MPDRSPDLSVVVQIGKERPRAANCLTSLLRQTPVDKLEVLLLDYESESFPPLVGSDHPSVRIIPRAAYDPIGESRAFAVREARAPVVAFLEDHCIAFEGWAEGILDAHRNGWKAIGCEVHNGNTGIGISDAIGLMNYSRWRPPARTGVHELLVGHNSSYDREVLQAYGSQLAILLRCDPVLQWKLIEDGHELFLDARIKIAHINETEISSIVRGYYYWNRIFAPTRAEVFHWSFLRKAIWVGLSPLIPLVRLAKQFGLIARTQPGTLLSFVRSIPVQWIAHTAAALGQVTGLLFGIRESEVAFLDYELNQVRRVGRLDPED